MGFLGFVVQSAAYLFSKELVDQWTWQSAANSPHKNCHGPVHFSSKLDVLGPFQIGTREAAWSADLLEYYGGFSNLQPNVNASFPSSITRNGRARWSQLQSSKGDCTSLQLSFAFPQEVDWSFLQNVYGWPALQWQAWARSSFNVNSDTEQTVLLYTDNILEYVIDGQRSFGGDFYGFRKAPAVLRLAPGKHVIDVRLVRDVRAMGGVGAPKLDITLEAVGTSEPGLFAGEVLLSDVIDGSFAAPHASVLLTNTRDTWLNVKLVPSLTDGISIEPALKAQTATFTLAPGQTRPFPIRLKLVDSQLQKTSLQLSYIEANTPEAHYKHLTIPLKLRHQSKYDTHKMTHLHPSGIVSYAVMRPPSVNATCAANETAAAVMVVLHGAGVEADNSIAKKALEPLPDLCAWILTPSGVTSWSADDWHTWGWADVQSALDALPTWLDSHGWSGIGADTSKTVLVGHSNGGQGVWYGLSHHPDRIVAAAPLSGYISIPWYVPTSLWRPMEALKRAIVQSATASFHHDLMVSNFAQIPIFQQHGDQDDNVPLFHSSLMHQLISESGSHSTFDVVKGQGHWWPTVATEPRLAHFYQQMLKHPRVLELDQLESFELVVADPGDATGRFGIRILHLQEQGKMGRLKVEYNKEKELWRFIPINVMAFEIPDIETMTRIEIVDGSMQSLDCASKVTANVKNTFWRPKNTLLWTMTDPVYPPTRQYDHFGGLSAVLRSRGPFIINATSSELSGLALKVSRNMHTYFGADTIIISQSVDSDQLSPPASSMVLFVGGEGHFSWSESDFPFRIVQHGQAHYVERLHLNKYWRALGPYTSQGMAFLRPRADQGLEVVVWGSDVSMATQMARLLPMMTGTGQPDWIVCGREMMWKGVEGCELGWFDAWWQIQD